MIKRHRGLRHLRMLRSSALFSQKSEGPVTSLQAPAAFRFKLCVPQTIYDSESIAQTHCMSFSSRIIREPIS